MQLGKGGEIFVPDISEPVNIAELARQMIRLSGFGEQDIRIEYSGLRPGEKLFEEVLVDDETTLPTLHPKLRIARARAADNDGLPEAVRARLKTWIAEYAPSQ